ncbi:monooxygenase [Streptomyces clavuligerus]|uniref:Putative monooxygenase n=1 Tax=Streptomyces clavuligerus TaxID=1901 RepID=E2PZE2_STRCL|nr:monooxygenase [Streptomyces clavuligerus]AXU11683.1 monooxygenase [Streptomyces clavuligerus]EFG10403.1 Putative monooxygenase [Streptomyces clavuligerus]QCS04463.1 monooxygenase [Streptomyces clavuligerus]QPJ96155.1 monooxygenase [Streptomyces clavuligerus]
MNVVVRAGTAGTGPVIRPDRGGHRVDAVERRGGPRGTKGPDAASTSGGPSERGRAASRDIGPLGEAPARAVPPRGRIVRHRGRVTRRPWRCCTGWPPTRRSHGRTRSIRRRTGTGSEIRRAHR